jgi:hypothetical protein
MSEGPGTKVGEIKRSDLQAVMPAVPVERVAKLEISLGRNDNCQSLFPEHLVRIKCARKSLIVSTRVAGLRSRSRITEVGIVIVLARSTNLASSIASCLTGAL